MRELKIGDFTYETSRVASIRLGIPYATLTKKIREANGDSEVLKKSLENYYKVVMDGIPYKSYAQASIVAKVPTPLFQSYVHKHGKKIQSNDVKKYYKQSESGNGKPIIVEGKLYPTLSAVGVTKNIPTTWLYRQVSLKGIENLDEIVKIHGTGLIGYKTIVGEKEYKSVAQVAQEYHISEATTMNCIKEADGDSEKLEELLESYKKPIVLIGHKYLRSHTAISRELGIPVKSVPDALKDHFAKMSWDDISKKYKGALRPSYGPFELFHATVPSILAITRFTGIRRGKVKDYYDKGLDIEKELIREGKKLYGDNFTGQGKYDNLFEEAFARKMSATDIIEERKRENCEVSN